MAGRIRDTDVALVRERTSIVDVVSEYVTLKPAGGGNVKGLCPFHDEKTPSFNVAAAKGVYFCYGCGAGGDAITFVMTLEHLSFVEAVERASKRLGLKSWRMPSGAGHDAQNLASVTRSGMVFIPSKGGRSHRPDETSDWRAIERGANVLLHTLLDLAS